MVTPSVDSLIGAGRVAGTLAGLMAGRSTAQVSTAQSAAVPPVPPVQKYTHGLARSAGDPVRLAEREDVGAGNAEDVPGDVPADAARRAADATGRYRYTVKFIDGLVRPLVQLVDTESDRLIASSPPEHVARMLEDAQRLGKRPEEADRSSSLDQSA
jgi:hypothetical protein